MNVANTATKTMSSGLFYEMDVVKASLELFTRDDNYVKKAKPILRVMELLVQGDMGMY